MLFRGRHPDQAFSTVVFRNWRVARRENDESANAPSEELHNVKFLHPSPSWHCHKVDTSQVGGEVEGSGSGPVELASTSEENKLSREVDDHIKIPLHHRSSAFKDSLFAFSGALGQYHLLAIPLLSLPGELDLLVNKDRAFGLDAVRDLSFFHFEFAARKYDGGGASSFGAGSGASSTALFSREPEPPGRGIGSLFPLYRGRLAVNFARRLFYLTAHSRGAGGSTAETALRLTVDGRYNSKSKGVFVEFNAAAKKPGRASSSPSAGIQNGGEVTENENNYCFSYALEADGEQDGTFSGTKLLREIEKNDNNFLHFVESRTILLNARETECYVWALNLDRKSNSLLLYISIEDGDVVQVEHPNSRQAFEVFDFDRHPGKFEFKTPSVETCPPAKEDRFHLFESPLELGARSSDEETSGSSGMMSSSSTSSLSTSSSSGLQTPILGPALSALERSGVKNSAPPVSLIAAPLEWPKLAEHFRNLCGPRGPRGSGTSETSDDEVGTTAEVGGKSDPCRANRVTRNVATSKTVVTAPSQEDQAAHEQTAQQLQQQTAQSVQPNAAAATTTANEELVDDSPATLNAISTSTEATSASARAVANALDGPPGDHTTTAPSDDFRGPLSHLLFNSAFQFDFTSVFSPQYAQHEHKTQLTSFDENRNQKPAKSHGTVVVDYQNRRLFIDSYADHLGSAGTGYNSNVQTQLLLQENGKQSFTFLKTRKGEKCVEFDLERNTLSKEANIENGFGLTHMREDKKTQTYPHLRKFNVRDIVAYADVELTRLTHMEIPRRGVNVDIRNWRKIPSSGGSADNFLSLIKPKLAFDPDNQSCEKSPTVLTRAHWTLADVFLA
ncbi:unnamed protein product [Amoebophrya sp. A120]|nr:unnamed protein product [Amoebophrya sp. A120]|eukprot:GSA120T00016287001.1